MTTPSRYLLRSSTRTWCGASTGAKRPANCRSGCMGKKIRRRYCGHSQYCRSRAMNSSCVDRGRNSNFGSSLSLSLSFFFFLSFFRVQTADSIRVVQPNDILSSRETGSVVGGNHCWLVFYLVRRNCLGRSVGRLFVCCRCFCFCFCLEKTYRLSHAQTNSVVVIIHTSFDKIMGKESGYASIIANRAACVHGWLYRTNTFQPNRDVGIAFLDHGSCAINRLWG
mmetsp:Transcript_5084/g.12478  ORF Transcript_5084/g.12478 Transcript_5084/m.12478 type:complete len:224 (+) Transcript_5084:1082-1753(+)